MVLCKHAQLCFNLEISAQECVVFKHSKNKTKRTAGNEEASGKEIEKLSHT